MFSCKVAQFKNFSLNYISAKSQMSSLIEGYDNYSFIYILLLTIFTWNVINCGKLVRERKRHQPSVRSLKLDSTQDMTNSSSLMSEDKLSLSTRQSFLKAKSPIQNEMEQVVTSSETALETEINETKSIFNLFPGSEYFLNDIEVFDFTTSQSDLNTINLNGSSTSIAFH